MRMRRRPILLTTDVPAAPAVSAPNGRLEQELEGRLGRGEGEGERMELWHDICQTYAAGVWGGGGMEIMAGFSEAPNSEAIRGQTAVGCWMS
jgi:hypothetical protein